MAATVTDRADLVAFLAENGASADAPNNLGIRSLFFAASGGNVGMLEVSPLSCTSFVFAL